MFSAPTTDRKHWLATTRFFTNRWSCSTILFMYGERRHGQLCASSPDRVSSATAAGYAGWPSTLRREVGSARPVRSQAGESPWRRSDRDRARAGNRSYCPPNQWPDIGTSTDRRHGCRSRRSATTGSDAAFRTEFAGSAPERIGAPSGPEAVKKSGGS